MNTEDVLKYGQNTVLQTIADLPEADCEQQGVCGWWSVKNIMAHLASYEQLLVEVFEELLTGKQGETMLRMAQAGPEGFNDYEVGARREMGMTAVLTEFNQTHAQTMTLISQIPIATRRTNGVLPWYGADYDLEDFIVYTFYGHKREHAAQFAVFRDNLKA
jgi:hypothetical protein